MLVPGALPAGGFHIHLVALATLSESGCLDRFSSPSYALERPVGALCGRAGALLLVHAGDAVRCPAARAPAGRRGSVIDVEVLGRGVENICRVGESSTLRGCNEGRRKRPVGWSGVPSACVQRFTTCCGASSSSPPVPRRMPAATGVVRRWRPPCLLRRYWPQRIHHHRRHRHRWWATQWETRCHL